MKRNFCMILTLMSVMAITLTVQAEEITRFDFQKYIGEGEYDLYRVETDLSKKSGELCFLRTAWSNIPGDVLQKLSQDTLWNRYIDIKKYDHVCFKFMLYDPFGWFYSQPFSYGDHEYRYFFVGNLNKKSMKGTVYQFVDHQEGDKHYRFIDDVDVSAQAVIMR